MRNVFLFCLIFFLIHNVLSAQPLQKGQAVVTFHVGPYVAKVINTRNNGLACPGVNWDGSFCPPGATLTQPPTWTRANMGAIFGIAINDVNGDIFFASSPILLDPWDATFQVSSTGIIFRAKGNTFALNTNFIINNPAYGIYLNTNQISNQQAGFGDIAHDPWHNQLFATNLHDGKIYRIRNLSSPTGSVASVYDPFAADPGNTTFPVSQQQRCWGVGVNRDNDGRIRVYFAREAGLTGQSEIWSVRLNGSGDFVAGSETFEFNGPNPGIKIPDIAFKPGDRMLIGERLGNGDHNSEAWEYVGTHLAWTAKQQVPIGNYSINENCAGGVDYGYRQAANDTMSLGACSKMIWASSDAIQFPSPRIYGICGIPADGPFTPYLSNALMVDFDGNLLNSDVKGELGDVEIYRDACPPEDICDQISSNGAQIDDPAAGKCCWSIGLNNEYEDNYFSAVQFCGLDGVQISYSGVSSAWDVLGHTPTTVTIAPHGGGGILQGNFADVVELCLSGYTSAPQKVVVKWLGPKPNNTVVCMDTMIFDCPAPDNPRCVRVINDTLSCKDGKYTFTFDLQNFAPFNVQSFMITPIDPNITVTPALTNLPFPGIPSGGGLGGTFTVNLTGSGLIPGNTFCFYLTAHNVPIVNGNYPQECCTDSVVVNCVPIPDCDPCDGVTITPSMAANPNPPGACCILLDLDNNYYPGYFTGVQIVGLGGVQLSYASGWAIDPPVYPSSVTFIPPGGTLGTGSFSNFAQICLNNFSTSPQYFVVNLLGPDSTVVCSDTFPTFCTPPPPPTCAVAVNDSLFCVGGQVKYTFSIKNSPLNTFNIESFNLLLADPTGFNVTQQYFVLNTPLAPGNTAGPFTIDVWGSAAQAGNQFCYIMTAHNGVWGGDPADYPTTCCTDSLNVRCLPIPDCDGISQDSCCCCTAQDLRLPNGFSPNGDGTNDTYEIINMTGKKCGKISLTIFNRWGNIVWETEDYQDQWDGTNQSGVSLPEGTYYALLSIPLTGLTLTNFVDLRR